MIITEYSCESRNKGTPDLTPKTGDILSMEKFSALPHPIVGKMMGGGEWEIETVCILTGIMRLNVCGKIDLEDFSMVKTIVDANGDEHDPDDFWLKG